MQPHDTDGERRRAWRVGPYLLDEGRFEARRNGIPIDVQKHVLDLLFFLLRSKGRLVTERDLIRGPWGGTTVTRAAIRRGIMLARRALEGAAEGESLIVTVRGKGFKFVGCAEEVPAEVVKASASKETARAPTEAAPDSARARRALDRRPRTSLVGRGAELAKLRDLCNQARDGEGGVALLVGPPGIGKTLLMEHLGAWARQEGMRVVWGRAWEAGGAPPFLPWLEVLQQLPPRNDAGGGEIDQAASDIDTLLSNWVVTAGGSESAQDRARTRFRLFGSIARLLDHAAADTPLLVLLEDLHVADDASVLMLRFRSRGIPFASRVLIVATCRDTAPSSRSGDGQHAAFHDLLFGDPGSMERIPLGGLALEELAPFLSRWVSAPLSPATLAAVHEATEGNPLLIEELARTGALRAFGRLECGTLQPLPIPERIGRAIRAHLDHLAPATLDLLSCAAVMGREFQLSFLAALSGIPATNVLAQIQQAIDSTAVEELPGLPRRYRFRHALIRETIYRDLPSALRHEYHAKHAAHLECSLSEDARHVSQLAHHYAAAVPDGDATKAVRFGLEAARQARNVLSYELSAEHYRRVLGLLAASVSSEQRQRRTVLMALAEVEALSTQPIEALAALNEAMRISLALRDRDGFAEGVLACFDLARNAAILHPAFHRGVKDALADRAADDRLHARLLAVNAFIDHFTTPFETRLARVQAAVSMARRLEDEETLREVLRFSHFSLVHPSQTEHNLVLARELAELSQKARCAVGNIDGLYWEAQHALTLGDGELFASAVQRHAQLAQAIKHPTHLWYASLLACTRLCQSGHLNQSEASLRSNLSLGTSAVGTTAAECMIGVQFLMLAWHTEDKMARRRLFNEARDVGRRFLEAVPVYVAWRLVLEVIDWELGEAPRVPWTASMVADWLSAIPDDTHVLLCLALVGHVAVAAVKEPRLLQRILERLTPYAHLHVTVSTFDWGPVLFHMGRLTEALGDRVEARRCYEAALERSLKARSCPWQRQIERALFRIGAAHRLAPQLRSVGSGSR